MTIYESEQCSYETGNRETSDAVAVSQASQPFLDKARTPENLILYAAD